LYRISSIIVLGEPEEGSTEQIRALQTIVSSKLSSIQKNIDIVVYSQPLEY